MTDEDPAALDTWRLGPLEVKRTTDVLAFVAFILSVIGLLSQLKDYFRGAEVALFATDQVDIGSTPTWQQFFENNDDFVLFGAGMSYVNSAAAGYNAAIRREYLRFTVDGIVYQYAAHDYVSTAVTGGQFKVEKKGDAGPFSLSAGTAVTHEVLFLPRVLQCDVNDDECKRARPALTWSEFKVAILKNPMIEITTVADIYGGKSVSVSCTLALGPADIQSLETHGWSGPDCHEQSRKGWLDWLV